MNKDFNYVGTIYRLVRKEKYPKVIELRKTKKLWIAKDGRKYCQKDGSTVYNPYTPVKLDISSIAKIK